MKTTNTERKKREDTIIPLRRPYRELVLGFVLFGAAAAYLFYRASTNDRGLILNGLIHLDPSGAGTFFVVLGLLSVGMSATEPWTAQQVAEMIIRRARETA
jgi:hypothetical protein